MMEFLFSHASALNLGVSVGVFLTGLIIYRFTQPAVFDEHAYMKRAFEFWLLLWFAYIVIWLIFRNPGPTKLPWLLIAVDLQTVFALGFFFVLFKGQYFRWNHTLIDLGLLFSFLTVWNFILASTALHTPPPSWARSLWILPSEIASATSIGLMALVFLLRYGPPAIAFGCVVFVYMVLQRPVYTDTFVQFDQVATETGWLVALAACKLFYAMLLYTLFFLDARNYGGVKIQFFSFPDLSPKLRGAAQRIASFLLGAVLTAAGKILAAGIERWWHSR
jgi:hypothetical protein